MGVALRIMEERIALVQEGVRRLGGQKERIVEELAWQMGRPVRYGGEFRSSTTLSSSTRHSST